MQIKKIIDLWLAQRRAIVSANKTKTCLFYLYTLLTTFVCVRSGPTEKIDSGISVN